MGSSQWPVLATGYWLVVWLLTLATALAACEQLPGDVLVTPTPIPTPVPLPKAVYRVERGDIIDSVTLLGIVDSQRRVNLSFRIGGRLNGFRVQPGGPVEAGQVLAELDVGFLPHELAKAQKQLEIARLRLSAAEGSRSLTLADAQAALELARLQLEQARASSNPVNPDAEEHAIVRQELAVETAETKLKLLTEQHDREMALLEAEVEFMAIDVDMLQARIEQTRLLAPFNGVVRYTDGEIGQMIAEYVPVMGLAAPDALEVRSSLPSEEEAPKLRLGQTVTIVFRDYPQREVTGKLIQVSTPARADGTDEGLPIRIEFTAPDLDLEIGSLADMRIVVEKKEDALTIPNVTIHSYFNRRYVLVKDGERTLEVDITLGVTDGERTEVLAGLEENEQIFER